MLCNWQNNPWSSGPQPDLGLDLGYLDRKRNAQQAYHEWMPTPFNVLPNSKSPYWKDSTTDEPYWKAYRFVSLGNLGRLILPETRLVARTQTDFYESDARRNLIDEFNTDSVREALWSCIVQNQTTWNGLMPSEIASLRSSNTTRANEVESCIEQARDISDTFRLNISKTMLGDEQHQWLEEVAQANEGKWTLISQEVVMQQILSGDYESAVAKKKAENQQEGNQWGETLDKVVNGTVGSLYTELCDFSNSPMKAADPLRKPHDAECCKQLSSDTKKYTQVENVAARFNVTTYFDSWPGYMHDKERLLSEIDPLKAPNPIVLSGDSHDAWMGLLYRNQTDGLQMKYSTADWRAVAPE
jgi:phosphodiesterase/alkaline phosphatase D-like protein